MNIYNLPMETDLDPDEQQAIVQHHITALMEHFEAVQILVSSSTPEGTESVFMGAGNWFARQGMARDFLNQDQARTNAKEIALGQPPESDD